MIVVGGEALIDLLVRPDGRVTAVAGGGPYNTARTIGRLGLPVSFVGGLSRDRFGEWLRAGLGEAGVSDALAVTTDAPTTLALAEIDARGGATYRFYAVGTSALAVTPDDVRDLPGDVLVTVTAIHVGTLGLVLEPLADAMDVLVERTPAEAVVMVDLNCRPGAITDRSAHLGRIERVLRRADIAQASTEDLAWWRPDLSPADAATALRETGPRAVLWTSGDGPARVVTSRGMLEVAPQRVEVVDTVGAGDAFGGGFLAAWVGSGRGRPELDGDDALLAAARHAIRVASLTCTRAGAEPPTAAELAGQDG